MGTFEKKLNEKQFEESEKSEKGYEFSDTMNYVRIKYDVVRIASNKVFFFLNQVEFREMKQGHPSL